MADLCVVCHHRVAHTVCQEDRKSMRKLLAELPRRVAALSLMLVPGQSPDGERVATSSHVEAPLPVRGDALSMVGPGAEVTGMLHPLMRRWSTQTKVRTHVTVGATSISREVTVTEWHREVVTGPDGEPIMVPDDDQIGTLPPREWCDLNVRAWRSQMGHRVPPRTINGLDNSGSQPGPSLTDLLPMLLRTRDGVRQFAALRALEDVGRRYVIAARFGLLGPLPPAQRPLDPLAEEVKARFGETPRDLALYWDVKYLLDHLDEACDRDLGISGFAAELLALTAELIRVLGEQPDQVWLGRCPAILVNRDDETETGRVCGAGLWQDPYTGSYSNGEQVAPGQVQCPRCHTTWGPRRSEITALAQQIRKYWPVDRRRRYNATEIDNLVPPTCKGCGNKVIIEWKDVTATRDKRRWWQPTGSRCTNGCEEARRAL